MSRSHCYIRVQLCQECIFFEKLMLSTCGACAEQRTLQQSGVHEALLKVSILEYFSLWLWPHKIFFCTLQTNNLHKKVSITDSGNERGFIEEWHFVFIYSLTPFVASKLFNRLVCLFVCFFAVIGLMKECMTIHKTLIHLRVLKDFLTIKDRYVSKE